MQIRLLLSFALRRFFCLTRGLKKHRELPSFCCSSVIWKKEISWAKITKQELLQRHIRRVILCHCCCYVGLIVFLSCTISPKNVFFLFLLFVRSFPSFLQPPVAKKVTCCLFAPGKKSFLLFNFFRRASYCRFCGLSAARKPTLGWRTVVRRNFWLGRFSN